MKLVKQIKSRSGELHFLRYRIFSTPWFGLYIHKIYKPDEDDLHCHPWNSKSVILSGEYLAASRLTPGNGLRVERKSFGSYTSMDRYDFHKILKIIKGPVTSLFLTWGRHMSWGYVTKEGYVDSSEYRRQKHAPKPEVAKVDVK